MERIVSDGKVTIIVPVYGDLPSLEKCIESLKLYLPEGNKVMLVNDRGPDWEILENRIKQETEGDDRFCYYLNPENLGFVKSCNRAVLELEDTDNDILLLNSDTGVTEGFLRHLTDALYSSPDVAVVCPRSNNATFLSIPRYQDEELKGEQQADTEAEKSYLVYQALKEHLPETEEIPTGVGFCMLIRRDLVRRYGLFDEVFSPGYNEENDFCMRVSSAGYKVLMANKAYVFHYEGKSFGKRRVKLEKEHREILLKRYPDYEDRIKAYNKTGMNAADFFSDFMVPGFYEKKRILLVLDGLKQVSHYEGIVKNILKELRSYDGLDIIISANYEDIKKYRLRELYEAEISKEDIRMMGEISERFHGAFVFSEKQEEKAPDTLLWRTAPKIAEYDLSGRSYTCDGAKKIASDIFSTLERDMTEKEYKELNDRWELLRRSERNKQESLKNKSLKSLAVSRKENFAIYVRDNHPGIFRMIRRLKHIVMEIRKHKIDKV